MQRENIPRGASIRFHAPSGLPVSASRALTVGAELVDSISLVHGFEKVSIAPRWWRRICNYTRYAKCTETQITKGLRVLVIVDPIHGIKRGGISADLVYEIDSRHGSVLRLGGGGVRTWF